MQKQINNIAVVLAGGTGTRMGLGMPKQFYKLHGRTVLEHSVDAFERNANIDAICIVSNPDFLAEVEDIVRQNASVWKKIDAVVPGGAQRYHSSLAAINHYASLPAGTHLIFHDAVRPLVSQSIISRVCQKLHQAQAVNVCVPATDTIVIVDAENRISTMPSRASVRSVQTPQGFEKNVIAQAYSLALADPDFQTTDDCGVVFRYLPQVAIAVVEGEQRNLKFTYPEDIPLFENMMGSTLPDAQP